MRVEREVGRSDKMEDSEMLIRMCSGWGGSADNVNELVG